MLRAYKNFYKRRIDIPVKWDALVLDVGSGDKPHWRADVLCDLYPETSYAYQRSGGGPALVTAPLVIGDVQKLPFKDKSFDFVVASHLLLNVPDVEAACNELMRVAKAGYIEVAAEGHAKINDFESHLWWCHKNGRRLVFKPKESMQYDAEIYDFSRALIRRKVWFEKIVHPHFDLVTNEMHWRDKFDYEVVDTVNDDLINEVADFEKYQHRPPRNKESLSLKLFRKSLKILMWHKTRKDPFYLESVLQCPESGDKEIVKVHDDLYRGKSSGEEIRLRGI